MAVIDCLEDPDETLKRKTLDLLYRMTNPVNVEFISDKLTQFLREASDVFLRTELVSRITQCAERYAPSNAWYIQTMTNVFELGGDLVRPEVAHNLLRLIAEGSGEDEDQDMELRRDAVDTYLELLERPVLPDILVCTMAWVLGEYGYLSDAMELEEICERLVELVDRPFDQEDTTRGYVLSAVTKITAQMGHTIDVADAMMDKYKTSRSTDLQQRCFEYLALTKNFSLMNEVFPEDASCEDIEVDPNLSFLTSFVEKAVAQGAPLYDPPEDSDDEDERYGHRRNGGDSNRLNFEAYKKPEIPYPTKLPPADQQGAFGVNKWGGAPGGPGGMPGMGSSGGPDPTGGFGAGKRGVVKNVWGPTGLNTPDNAAPGAPGAPGAPAAQGGYPSDPYNQGNMGGQSAYGGQGGYGAQPAYGAQGGYGSQPPQQPPQQEYGAPNNYDNGEPSSEDEANGGVDDRQMLASALFGGIPGAPAPMPSARRVGSSTRSTLNSNRRSGRSSSRRTSGRSEQQQQQQPPQQAQAPVEQAPPPQQQPKVEMDLLDISFDAPAAPQNTGMFQQQQAPPQQPQMVSADPFGMGSPLAPPPALETSSPAPPASLDPFDMSGLGSSMNAAVELGKSPGTGLDMLGGSSSNTSVFQYNGRQLEPWQITTQDFGGRWGTCPCEKKTKVNPSGIRTLEDFMGRMHQFNVHTVEAIPTTNEAIAACRLVNSEHVGLIHVKIRSGGFVDLTVRTADMNFTDQLLEAAAQRLKAPATTSASATQDLHPGRQRQVSHTYQLVQRVAKTLAGLRLAVEAARVEVKASSPLLINMACARPEPAPQEHSSLSANPQKTGQRSARPSTRKQQRGEARAEESQAPAEFQPACCDYQPPASSDVRAPLRALSVRLLRVIAQTFEAAMQPTTDTMKPRARAVSSDNAKPTIVLNLPGVRVAVLTSAYDSLLHLDVTLSSAASLLLASYVACVLAWNILSFVLVLLAETAAFALISFYTFMGLAMLSMNAAAPNAASVRSYCPYASLPHKTKAAATPTLPLLCVDGATISSRSAHVGKTDDAAASKRKELQAPAARRRVLAHLNRNRLLVNVVPGDMRRRVDMNLGEANIRRDAQGNALCNRCSAPYPLPAGCTSWRCRSCGELNNASVYGNEWCNIQ
ncbi:hypothetical protein ON010_g498 [Phytophthora cinnamomi]|nr:hypothetical protein ON010_g498 [Phytophthora cinnamomi]